ncbi:peptide deformylase [Actinomadura monticuli]|uniref:Peptide deformylase n=1 Tax=Actinomadura monticuli TaxID=3097367 RepID=A0ABV4QBE7_9ACTN
MSENTTYSAWAWPPPQLGIDRAAAVIAPPDPDAEPLMLLNPRVISASAETDEQYEGCPSFFDARGLVPRPLKLEVAHTRLHGRQVVAVLQLYTDRMREGVHPIPVEDYRGTGQAWT